MTQWDPLLERARKNRGRLSAPWESESSLERRLPAREMRKAGKLLAVWVAGAGEFRYPPFQFDPPGPHYQKMSEILPLVRGRWDRGASGWHEVEWFLAPRLSLDGLAPAMCFPVSPDRVLRLAQEEVSRVDVGGW